MRDAVGWVSSLVLIATVTKQVHTQWASGTSAGVSRWLYAGQCAASAGFTAYSALVRNWVFVVTNAVLLVSAIVGWAIDRHHRAHGNKAPGAAGNAS